MSLPGIEVRPIIEMTGGNHFNEVFFTDVRIPLDCRIGPEHDGWRLAKVTLGNERLSLSEGGVIWGMGPTSDDFFELVAAHYAPVADPIRRQQLASVYTDAKIIELLGSRLMTMLIANDPMAEAFASIRKTRADVHGQHLTSVMKDLLGADAMLGIQSEHAEHDDLWHWAYLFSRALTIGGGTSEVQRNIIGERILGLPREPNPT